jgi:hypothetical protein
METTVGLDDLAARHADAAMISSWSGSLELGDFFL